MTETAINYTSDEPFAHFASDERKWVTRMLGLAAKYPEEVKILQMPETNGGYLLMDVPKSWFKIAPPIKRDLTEDQRTALSERAREMRQRAQVDKQDKKKLR